MKGLSKLIVNVFLLGILCFATLQIFLTVYAKKYVSQTFEKILLSPVEIKGIWFWFPAYLHVEQMTITQFPIIKRISFDLDLWKYYSEDEINFHSIELERADMTVELKGPKRADVYHGINKRTIRWDELSLQDEKGNKVFFKELSTGKSITLGSLKINQANAVIKTDEASSQLEWFKQGDLQIKNCSFELTGLAFPFKPERVSFAFDGMVQYPKSVFIDEKMTARGWFDVIQKNMRGTVKIENPSQQRSIDLQLSSENDQMTVSGHLLAKNPFQDKNMLLHREDFLHQKLGNSSLNEWLYGIFEEFGSEIETDFYFDTHMSDFKVDEIQFTGNFVLD
ncbi:MAG: hypothetical protein KC713_05875 [Candidatus Omnitrophica bacterium]|nr:hypothetical protein [Candidatus Omnitrophota bacterium]